MPKAWIVQAAEVLKFAGDVWAAFEPAPNSVFEVIDAHILRIALESAFRGVGPTAPFKTWVATAVSYEGLPAHVENYWIRFLTREIDAVDICIFPYSSEPSQDDQTSHFGIIARATLLLRVATGSAAELIRQAGFSANDIAFWWQSWGQVRGLWEGKRENGTLIDLWADVVPSLQEITAFQEKYQDVDQTFFQVERQLAPALIGLGNCERIAAWSLIPST
jgi:hypothetical protein